MILERIRVSHNQLTKAATSMLLLTFFLAATNLMAAVTLAQEQKSLMGAGELASYKAGLLWSPDEIVRDTAKRELLIMGSSAVPSLLSLLRDVSQKPSKVRSAITGERDGSIGQNIADDNSTASRPDAPGVDITARLQYDAIELLGRLQAVEAVPILIELMEKELALWPPRGMNPMMRALAEIGAPAVEMLIQEVETTDDRVALRDMQVEPDDLLWGPDGVERIQAGAVLVLGEIGDPRALPILRNLLERDPWLTEMQTVRAKEAIRKIEEKLSTPRSSKGH